MSNLKLRTAIYAIAIALTLLLIVAIAIKWGALTGSKNSDNASIVLVETEAGYPILVNINDQYQGQYITKHKNFKNYMDHMYEQFIKPDSTIVDVGAAYGYRSVMMAKQLNRLGVLYAIESRNDTFKILDYNIRLNLLPNVITINKTVFSKRSPVILEVPDNDYSASRIITEEQAKKLRKHNTLFKITAYTLDELLNNVMDVDLLRLDTNGSELEVLIGASKLLERSPNIVIFIHWSASLMREHSDMTRIVQDLIDLGFNFWTVDEEGKAHILSRKNLLKLDNADVILTKQSL